VVLNNNVVQSFIYPDDNLKQILLAQNLSFVDITSLTADQEKAMILPAGSIPEQIREGFSYDGKNFNIPENWIDSNGVISIFDVPQLTADGFTCQINNYNSSNTYSVASTSGSVAVNSTNGLITVSGVESTSNVTISLTTNQTLEANTITEFTITVPVAPKNATSNTPAEASQQVDSGPTGPTGPTGATGPAVA
jgi:hypothetical protein